MTAERIMQRNQVDEIADRLRATYVSNEDKHQQQQPQPQPKPKQQQQQPPIHDDDTIFDGYKRYTYDEIASNVSGELDDINHLLHINFMQSMQQLNAREKRSVFLCESAYFLELFNILILRDIRSNMNI